ncbi:MAG: Rrf2 family transcriptional regulator [Puniceicoccaceae bacterium]|nr:MAG: Rrf2 family transcriptional regulator [Puniceicoccaceae bacterium]
MKLSVKAEYACRVLVALAARHPSGTLAHIEELAEQEQVPSTYLVQILGELRNGGLILSRRGKQGGYALARMPGEISLLDVVNLLEGGVLSLNGAREGQSAERVGMIWSQVRSSLEETLRQISLEDFLHAGKPQMYYI